MMTEPRGITRWCPACPVLVTPPGVLAPYEHGGATGRQVKTQRERDDDAKKTVLIAGEFLRSVRAMLNDPQIHPASADLLTWYEEEITEARKDRDGRRLAELADEFDSDRETGAFRRRHWWQGQPPAIEAADDDDDDEYADDDDGGQGDEPAAVVLATPVSIAAQQHRAQPQRMTWADAIDARSWRLAATHTGLCQMIDETGQQCTAATNSPAIVDRWGGHAWLCQGHYGALGATIGEHNRRIA